MHMFKAQVRATAAACTCAPIRCQACSLVT